jgi:hypothetical protein
MKPDIQFCKWCGNSLEGREGKEFCKDSHRKAYKRNPDKAPIIADNVRVSVQDIADISENEIIADNADKSEEDTPELSLRDTLSKCDKTFFDRAMRDFNDPYYRFSEDHRKIICGFCGEKATTSLSLNRYCSYAHYKASISGKITV